MASLISLGLSLVAGMALCMNAWASDVSIPHTFTSGTPAVAAEVKANFSAVKTAVDDKDLRFNQTATSVSTGSIVSRRVR